MLIVYEETGRGIDLTINCFLKQTIKTKADTIISLYRLLIVGIYFMLGFISNTLIENQAL